MAIYGKTAPEADAADIEKARARAAWRASIFERKAADGMMERVRRKIERGRRK
jgi:hypothetical protein